jgi:hypothetical protein
MHISCKIRGAERNFGSYMRTGVMEDSQGSYSHEEDIIDLHFSMGNFEIN